jgi:hypothetical protein
VLVKWYDYLKPNSWSEHLSSSPCNYHSIFMNLINLVDAYISGLIQCYIFVTGLFHLAQCI